MDSCIEVGTRQHGVAATMFNQREVSCLVNHVVMTPDGRAACLVGSISAAPSGPTFPPPPPPGSERGFIYRTAAGNRAYVFGLFCLKTSYSTYQFDKNSFIHVLTLSSKAASENNHSLVPIPFLNTHEGPKV